MGKGIQKVTVLLMAIVLSMLALTVFDSSLTTLVTNPTTQAFTATNSQATMTLTLTDGESWYSDLTSLTVTGATTGAFDLASTTIDANRTVLTIPAQAGGSASETVTVAYLTEDLTSDATTGWKLIPLIIVGIALAAVGGTLFVGYSFGRRGDVAAAMAAMGVLFVGVILGEVVAGFTGDATTLYANQPDYTGIGSLLPIVDLGYVFGIIGIAVGGLIGAGKSYFS